MKQKLTGICAVLLAAAMGVSMAACGGKAKDDSKTDAEQTAAVQTTAEPTTEAKGGVGSTYHYSNADLELVKITDDAADMESSLADPTGKYVVVEFKITNGKMTGDEMTKWKEGLQLNGVKATKAVGLGGEMDSETFQLVITEGMQVYFDMPADTVVEDLKVTATEE